MKSYVYLHGFASSPASSKAQYFNFQMTQRGIVMEVPELDGGDFRNLTISSQLSVLERLIDRRPAVLIGSSLGGYLAALYAERHPEIERLVLMAPAFDFARRLAARVGERGMQEWQITGQLRVFHYGSKHEEEIAYALYQDAVQYPAYPDVQQPALVLQGLHDDVVPPEQARHFCDLHPATAQLRLLASGHELTDLLPEIWKLTEDFLLI